MFRVLPVVLLVAALGPSAVSQANTTATLKGTTLKITGGADADDLLVTNSLPKLGFPGDGEGGSSGETVVLTPQNGTTLNGETEAVAFNAVKVLKIKLEEGGDQIEFDNFDFTGTLTLRGGDGDDQVTFTDSNMGPCKLFGDANDDSFDLQSSSLGVTKLVGSTGALSLTADASNFVSLNLVGGPGTDSLTWTSTNVDGNLKANFSFGDDILSLTDSSVGEDTQLKLSIGVNSFTDDNGAYGALFTLTAGPGDDEIAFTDAQIGETANFKLGPGVNMLTLTAASEALQIGENLLVKGGPQDDVVTLAGTGGIIQVGESAKFALAAGVNTVTAPFGLAVGENFSFSGGGQDDHVLLDSMVAFDVKCTLAAGTNEVVLTDCTISGDLKVTAGSGDDTVEFAGTTSVAGDTKINLGGGNNIQP